MVGRNPRFNPLLSLSFYTPKHLKILKKPPQNTWLPSLLWLVGTVFCQPTWNLMNSIKAFYDRHANRRWEIVATCIGVFEGATINVCSFEVGLIYNTPFKGCSFKITTWKIAVCEIYVAQKSAWKVTVAKITGFHCSCKPPHFAESAFSKVWVTKSKSHTLATTPVAFNYIAAAYFCTRQPTLLQNSFAEAGFIDINIRQVSAFKICFCQFDLRKYGVVKTCRSKSRVTPASTAQIDVT